MSGAKSIIYRFSNPCHDEVEVALTGALSFTKGDIVWSGGKVWKVQGLTWDDEIGDDKKLPALWGNLTEMRVN